MKIDQHRADFRQLDGEPIPVGFFKSGMKEFPGNSGIFHSETENVGLTLELHIDIVHHDQFLDVDSLPLDELGPFPNLVLKGIPYGFHVHLL